MVAENWVWALIQSRLEWNKFDTIIENSCVIKIM